MQHETSEPSGLTAPTPIAWLLLQDGHAIPITGLAPDDLKAASTHAVLAPDREPLPHRRRLTAIAGMLGFRGDFGNYVHEGWPKVQRFLRDRGCGERRDLFSFREWGTATLHFSKLRPNRRQLADRIFVSGHRRPSRVFLGAGVDWAAWDEAVQSRTLSSWSLRLPHGALRAVGAPVDFLIANRHELVGQWGFLDDKLVDGEVREVINKTYHAVPRSQAELDAHAADVLLVVRAFRAAFPENGPGWVDVLPFEDNDRLVFLRAPDGTWDLIWRDLRTDPPPQAGIASSHYKLHPRDLPRLLASEQDLARRHYERRGIWDEREAHLAEQHFYDVGHTQEQRLITSNEAVRERWLADTNGPRPGGPPRTTLPPPRFESVRVGDRTVLVSPLITLGEFRAMLADTDYLERRDPDSEPWDRANDEALVPPEAPVGATWADAQAFCAWKEQQLGQVLRLPSVAELRALRPFHSEHYEYLAAHDFPWEKWPPRPLTGPGGNAEDVAQVPVPSAVAWSEPRFHEPGPGRPEYPARGGWALGDPDGRRRWIEDFPPRAAWTDAAWAEHSGLRFIDAWDAYEWAQEQGFISGRFWQGPIGPNSWGAYKNVKVGFRVVLDGAR